MLSGTFQTSSIKIGGGSEARVLSLCIAAPSKGDLYNTLSSTAWPSTDDGFESQKALKIYFFTSVLKCRKCVPKFLTPRIAGDDVVVDEVHASILT